MKSISIANLIGGSELMGIAAGKKAGDSLLSAVSGPPDSRTVVLDFGGIDLITASAARESVLKLTSAISEQGALAVLVNVNEATLDELTFAAEALRQPLVVAETRKDGSLSNARILGSLEPSQRHTLAIVARLGEADAKTASQEAHDSSAGVTAWNNRLSSLATLRLLQERKVGKTKLYSLTVEGLAHGH